MSWAEEDWTVGLSGRVLQKVKELQIHQERLSRENKQKQLQLDNIHTNLEKQTVKYEEVRGELQSVQRELQSVREEAKAAVTGRDRLTQDLQTKQAQVCSLEGQLDAARSLSSKLTQEVKRLEAELEKLQNSRAADTTLFSTPCWNTASPWENNGSRNEEKTGQRDEGQSRVLHIRRLQFSDVPSASSPQQQKVTPHRHPSNQSDVFSTPSAAFPWERDDSRPAARRRQPPSPLTACTDGANQALPEQRVCGKDEEQRADTERSLSKMRSHISALEEQLSTKTGTLKAVQNEVAQKTKELAAKELSLQRARDELSLAHTRMAQDSERVSGAEQKLKHLQEELKCQRQNAESSRVQHLQRTKELEKQHQRDLTEQQRERQSLEKQHQQEVNKLNQELQQARTLHNALQAQADKLSLQKQVLEKELDTQKEKLKWTEGQLKESQKKETQTQAKLTEAVREAEGVAVSLEQSRKRERALEEEGRRLVEERADTLRLLKELQEQKSAPQPVQFCPVVQSFPPQSSVSHSPRPPAHTKRSAATRPDQRREEEDKERTAPYPPDREPGEGIDSEHISVIISPDTECLRRTGHRRKSNEEENESNNETMKSDISGPNNSGSSHSADDIPIKPSMDGDRVTDPDCKLTQTLMLSAEKTPSLTSEHPAPSEDLKRENAMLQSELQDVRQELQKRLEDLESQRRAEAEARTRLKQLSRKQASQAVEREEKDKEWKTQLESERAEAERLRKAVSALEVEIKRRSNERDEEGGEEKEEEKSKELEDRETEMIELNIQLKKQLVEVKAQLALEREERNQMSNLDIDEKKELSTKVAELTAEVENLKQILKENSQEEESLSDANSPLTYLTLHDDELNSNVVVCCDDNLLPSPERHLRFCQSTNQRNVHVSRADLIQEDQSVIDDEHLPLSGDDQTGQVVADLEDTRQIRGGELVASDLSKEVERLQKEYKTERERANQYQVKLEALQNQVTRQTQQLTMAFENQSLHISGLLQELQEKESALLSQGEELVRCKQELDGLKKEKEEETTLTVKEAGEDGERGERGDEKVAEISKSQEKERAVTFHSTNVAARDSNAPKDTSQRAVGTLDAEKPSPRSSEADVALRSGEHPDSVDSNRTQSHHDSAGVMAEDQCIQQGETADMATELLALRRENQRLKQRIEAWTVSETTGPTLQSHSENQEDQIKQSQSTMKVSSSPEPVTRRMQTTTEGPESLLKNVKRLEDEGQDLEVDDETTTRAEEELDQESEVDIDHLQQQVEALQMKIRALSVETQQQTEELAMWRLASQPAPTFDQSGPNQQQQQQQTDEPIQSVEAPVQGHTVVPQKSQDNVTVVREDELYLNCSSNKLQGRLLFSRLQNSIHPDPKSDYPSKKMDTPKIDQESEKENQEINFSQRSHAAPTQHKTQKRDTELIQMSPEKTAPLHVAKDPQKSNQCHAEKLEAKPNSSRDTGELNTASDVRVEMISVSSQTEDSLYPSRVTTACVNTQTEEEEEDEGELVDSPPVSPVPLSEGAKSGDKLLFSGSFPIPADPARLAERIRRNRTQLSAAFDDTEYEPYGLPEVVMKGFADIPSGPSCPYIVRRGLLGTTVVPVSQKNTKEEEETD
ncbi:centromere protein F [Mugil cephalus]|uniref:centromere protein F n=1 Tax=Mugil cephalus TaxID=48193 RepID=UPI001FB85F69|nr:centromere protein F [Mugil cephalus]